MPPKSKIQWELQGKPVTPTKIKVELIESYKHELLRTAGAIVEDTEKLIETLDRRSTNRGQGFYAVRYNHPLSGAHTEVVEKKGGKVLEISVPSQQKGDAGYIFNLLDQGRPSITKTDGKPMKFPSYDGTKTKSEGNTNVVNRSRVTSPSVKSNTPKWITTSHVDAIVPRKFFEAILAKRKFKNPNAKLFGKINLKPPKFKWEAGTVDIKVKRRG